MQSDPLSEVLRTVRLSGGMFFRVRLSAPYAITAMDAEQMLQAFAPEADHMLPFHIVTEGEIWFDMPGHEPLLLKENDVIVFPHGTLHSLTDEPGRTPVPVGTLMDQVSGNPPLLRHGGAGAGGSALCGFFHCRGRLFNPLMESLPEVLVIPGDDDMTPWLTATMRRTFDESIQDRPGATALVERLTELLFVEVVQYYLRQNPTEGWFGGVADPVVGKALALLHAEPAKNWSVESLARACGASRSALSERFGKTVGDSPIRYLTAWRMELAAQQMLDTDASLAEIAEAVGYESEASFNRAFKRHAGEPPATWRRARLRSVG